MFDDPVIDDEALREKKEKDARKCRAQELDDLKTVLRYAQGRRLLWRIMMRCNPFANPYNKDPTATAYNCGLQSVGRWLFGELHEAKAGSFDQMRNEYEAAQGQKNKEETDDDL